MARVARVRSQDERKLIAKVKSSESERDELFYAVQIPLLIHVGATSFRERDMNQASQIVVSMAENFLFPQEQHVERRDCEPPDKSGEPADTISIAVLPPSWQLLQNIVASEFFIWPFSSEGAFVVDRSQMIVDCGINIVPKFWASCHRSYLSQV